MGLLNQKMLQIVKGVGPVPGDTASAEQPIVAIDLLDSGSGISLDLEDGWTPNIPSLKNGGVWADSPISDGRTLIAGVNTNVTETMRLIVSTQNAQVYAAIFAGLQRMIQDARAFWDTFTQIEPVYIAWWAAGAPGPQYALIFNIDMDVEFEDSEDAQTILTLTIEREVGWRGVRPGGNPKEWAFYLRQTPMTISNASLYSGTGNNKQLVEKNPIVNRMEWTTSAHLALSAQNFIEIPASLIPGDLPALCLLTGLGQGGISTEDTIMIYRHTLPFTLTDRNGGANQNVSLILNAAEGGLGTDASLAADTGASTGNRVRVTFATATLQNRVQWTATEHFFANLFRGQYAVFVRARVSAAATVQLQLQLQGLGGFAAFSGTTATLTDLGAGGTGNTTEWNLTYLGTVTIPLSDRTYSSMEGTGINLNSISSDLFPVLMASRTSVTGELYINDLIFVPLDEPGLVLSTPANDDLIGRRWIVDTTGYVNHGRLEDTVQYGFVSGVMFNLPANWSGQAITLLPGRTNRIHLLIYINSTKRTSINTGMSSVLNIVPRWSGIRDA